MANLIPPHVRKIVHREYWMRVAAVWMFLIAAACLVVAILEVPTYVLIESQHAALENRIDTAEAQNDAFTDAKAAVESANKLATYIDTHQNEHSLSLLIEEIEELAPAGITITQYQMDQTNRSLEPFMVRGAAANRNALASFRDALNAHEGFASVDLPLANLAGAGELPFSITITPQKTDE